MAVSFVAGSTAVFNTANTINATTPAGIQNGDTILAGVFGRGTLNTPSGWTKLDETAQFSDFFEAAAGDLKQRLAVYSKNTVTSSDSSTSFTFSVGTSESSEPRMGVAYVVLRGVDTIPQTIDDVVNDVDTYSITPGTATADQNGSAIVIFASVVLDAPGNPDPPTPSPPSSFTLTSGAALSNYRLAAAYRLTSSGQSNSGAFNMGPDEVDPPSVSYFDSTNGLGAIVVRLNGGSASALFSRVDVPSPAGAPAATITLSQALLVSVPSPLGEPAATVATDFHDLIDGRPVYAFMDVTDALDVTTRIPVSSWQGTIQVGGQCYLRCSVTAPTDEQVTAMGDAVSFSVTISTTTWNGETIERVIGTCPEPSLQTDQGATNYTAQLYGYFPEFPTRSPTPDPAFYRPVRSQQSLSVTVNSFRIRCAYDWIMMPSDLALTADAFAFAVAYMNFYGTDGGRLMYMDIGSRAI